MSIRLFIASQLIQGPAMAIRKPVLQGPSQAPYGHHRNDFGVAVERCRQGV